MWKKRNVLNISGRARRAGLLTLIAGAGTVGLMIPSLGTVAQASESHSVKPDLSYFRGKSITLIAPDAPGGQYDYVDRAVAPGMGAYLHATVSVINVPLGNTLTGTDQVGAAAPNGLTLGAIDVPAILENDVKGLPSVNFPIVKAVFLGGIPNGESLFVSSPSDPAVATMADVIKTTVPFSVLDATSGLTDAQVRVFMGAYNVTAAKIVTGYANGAAQVAGLLRGDGPVSLQAESLWIPSILTGQTRPILQSSAPAKNNAIYKYLKDVPTFASFDAAHPPKTAEGRAAVKEVADLSTVPIAIFAPPGTKPAIALALTDAMHFAIQQSSTKATLLHDGEPTAWVSPSVILQDVKVALNHDAILKRYLG